MNGFAVDGIYVVDKVIRSSNRAKWRLVPVPSHPNGLNRLGRFEAYLSRAKEQAKSVPQDVDLGIHNPGDPKISFTPTKNGSFMNLKY